MIQVDEALYSQINQYTLQTSIAEFDQIQTNMLENLKKQNKKNMQMQMKDIHLKGEYYIGINSLENIMLKYSDQYISMLNQYSQNQRLIDKMFMKQQTTESIKFEHNFGKIWLNTNCPDILKSAPPLQIRKAFITSRKVVQNINLKQYIGYAFDLMQQKISLSPAALYYLFAIYGLKFLTGKTAKITQIQRNDGLKFSDAIDRQQNAQYLKVFDFFQIPVVSFKDNEQTSLQPKVDQTQIIKFKKDQDTMNKAESLLQQIGSKLLFIQKDFQKITQKEAQDIIISKGLSEEMKSEKFQNVNTLQVVKTQKMHLILVEQSETMDQIQKVLNQINTPELIQYLEDKFIKKKNNKISRKSRQIKSALLLLNSYLKSINVKQASLQDRYPDLGTYPPFVTQQILMIQREVQLRKQILKKFILQTKLKIHRMKHKTAFQSNQLQKTLQIAMPFIIQQTFLVTQKPILQINILVKKGSEQISRSKQQGKMTQKITQLAKFFSQQNTKSQLFISNNFNQSFNKLRQLQQTFDENKFQISKLGDNLEKKISTSLSNQTNKLIYSNEQLYGSFASLIQTIQGDIQINFQSTMNLIKQNIENTNYILQKVDKIFTQIIQIKDNVIQIKQKIDKQFQNVNKQLEYIVQRFNDFDLNNKLLNQNALNTGQSMSKNFELISKTAADMQDNIKYVAQNLSKNKQDMIGTFKSMGQIISGYSNSYVNVKKQLIQSNKNDGIIFNSMNNGRNNIFQFLNKLFDPKTQGSLYMMINQALTNNFQKSKQIIGNIQLQLNNLGTQQINNLNQSMKQFVKQGQSNVTSLTDIYKNANTYAADIRKIMTQFKALKQLSFASDLNSVIFNTKKSIQNLKNSINTQLIGVQLSKQQKQDLIKRRYESVKSNISLSNSQYEDIKNDFISKIKSNIDLKSVKLSDKQKQNLQKQMYDTMRNNVSVISKKINDNFAPLSGLDFGQYKPQQFKNLVQSLVDGFKILNIQVNQKYPIIEQLDKINNGISTVLNKINSDKGSGSGSGGNDGDQSQWRQQNAQLKKKITEKSQLIDLMQKILLKVSQLIYQTFQDQSVYTYDIARQMFGANILNQKQYQAILEELMQVAQSNAKNFEGIIFGKIKDTGTSQVMKSYTRYINTNLKKRDLPKDFKEELRTRKFLHY